MTQPLTPEREAEIHAALSKYGQHPSIGFACCSAHDAADAAPDLLAELEWVRRAYVVDTAELKRTIDRLRLELTAVEESATRTRLADMDAPQPTPGRDARYELYAALTYPQWNPATNSHSTGEEKAERLIAAHRAQVLAEEANAFVAACPDHSKADETWMDCPCEFAGELRRRASAHTTEATS